MNKTMISKREAAAFLGISLRTLERYTREGKLVATPAKGRSRPTPCYDERDLEALKVTIDERRRTAVAAPAQEAPIVAFRLPDLYFDLLREEGVRHAMSPGAYARNLVIDALEGTVPEQLQDDLAALRQAIEIIGTDLASATLALLLNAGQIESEITAREWVVNHLQSVRLREQRR